MFSFFEDENRGQQLFGAYVRFMDEHDIFTETGAVITRIEVVLERIEGLFGLLHEMSYGEGEEENFRNGVTLGFLVAKVDQIASLLARRHQELEWVVEETTAINSTLMGNVVMTQSGGMDMIAESFRTYTQEVRNVLAEARDNIAGHVSNDGTLFTNDQIHAWLSNNANPGSD